MRYWDASAIVPLLVHEPRSAEVQAAAEAIEPVRALAGGWHEILPVEPVRETAGRQGFRVGP